MFINQSAIIFIKIIIEELVNEGCTPIAAKNLFGLKKIEKEKEDEG